MNARPPNDSDGTSGNDNHKSRTTLIERSILLKDNRLNSRDVFVETREITIAHGDETYRLRLTAQNKLILTK